MRFFKIFLIVFFSLIGVFGITYGILYAVGYFDQEKVKPENIFFEQSVYNEVGSLDNDGNVSFEIEVQTSTQNVTEKRVTLSFKNQSISVSNGRLSNGVISIPQYANIGEPFKVIVSQEYYDETEGNWNKGGSSTIVARTDVVGVTQAETTINIDVPVYFLNVVAKSSGNQADTFAVNSTFTVEPQFTPESSAYMFGSTTEQKSVYYAFTIAQGNVNDYIQDLGYVNGKRTFKALKPTETEIPITIKAYCFKNSQLQQEYEAMYEEEGDLITQASNETLGKSAEINVSFVTQTISGFEISQTSGKQLPFNKTSVIYANSNNENDNSLGINVLSTDTSADMAYKIADMGIRILYPEGSTGDEVKIVEYSDSVVVKEDGEIKTYYYPQINLTDYNKSYWTVAVNNPDFYFNIEVRIFGDKGIIEDEDAVKKTPYWSTAGIETTKLTWKNEAPITLTYEDAQNEEDIVHQSYNLYNNINITQGSYTTVKYIAYTTVEGEDITKMISGLVATDDSLFNFDSLFASYGLGTKTSAAEIESINGEFETLGVGTFNVIAVVIQTDYLGAPILDNQGNYQIVTIVKNIDNELSNQPLEFTITKTLKKVEVLAITDSITLNEIKGEITAENVIDYNLNYDIDGVKNQNDDSYSNKYAFKGNNTQDPAFVLEIRFYSGIEEKEQAVEQDIFINAWNSNLINIQFSNASTGVPTSVITYTKTNISAGNIRDLGNGVKAIYIPMIARNVSQDIELKFELTYQKTESKTVSVNALDYNNTALTKNFEVYDGNPAKIEFGKEESIIKTEVDNRIVEKIEISGVDTTPVSDTKIATEIGTTYSLNNFNGDLEATIFDETTGRYNVVVYDKYGNIIMQTTDGVDIVNNASVTAPDEDGNFEVNVSTSTKSSALISEYPTATLYFNNGSQNGYVSRIKYYEVYDKTSQSQEYLFDKNDYDGVSEIYDSSKMTVNIQTLGVKARTIDLIGSNIIFEIYYTLDEQQYVLNEVTNFSSPDLKTNNEWIELNGDIEILENFGTSYSFKLVATVPGISSINQVINVTIEPAIVLANSTINETTIQSGAESVGDNPVYRGVYSDNNIIVDLKWEHEFGSTRLINVCDENGNAINLENGLSSAIISDDSKTLTLYFGADRIGQQIITLYSGNDPNNVGYGFKQNLYFNVNANVSVDKKNCVYEQDGTLNLGTHYLTTGVNEEISIYGTDSSIIGLIKNIANKGDALTNFSSIYLSFDGNSIITDETYGTFEIINDENSGAKIKILKELIEKETLQLYILYGSVGSGDLILIEKMQLTISPNVVTPDISAENNTTISTADGVLAHTAFANYNLETENDNLHLVLVSGYKYNFDNILGIFKDSTGKSLTHEDNVGEYSLSFVGNPSIYSTDDNSITINTGISNVNQSTFTITQNGVGAIQFNALILPGEYEYVKYKTSNDVNQTADYANLINKVNKNIYLINNKQYIEDENIYDSYDGGKEHDLYNLFEIEGYGISDYYKTNFSFKIENEDGTLNPNAYATFNASTGILSTYTYGTEKFIKIICYVEATQTEIFSYRIKIVPSAKLNVYYPYIYGANPVGANVAEYLEFESNSDIHLNLNETFTENIPNYEAGKRFVLQVETNGVYEDVKPEPDLKFYIDSLFVGNIEITGTNIEGFLALTENGDLTIKYLPSSMLTIVVRAEAYLGENYLGSSALYKIIVNYAYEELAFKTDDLNSNYNESEIEIDTNYVLSMSDRVTLAVVSGGIVTKSDLLRYHIYDINQIDKLDFDRTSGIISLKEGEKLVSDLTFKVVLYTLYGKNTAYKEIDVVFKSNISATLNEKANYLYKQDATYYTYSDRTLNLNEILSIEEGGSPIQVTDWNDVEIEVIDLSTGGKSGDITLAVKEGSEGSTLADLTLPQLKSSKTYSITLKLPLTSAGEEKFVYNFILTVYPNIVTNTSAQEPLVIDEIIYSNETGKNIVASQVLATSHVGEIVAEENSLFTIITTGDKYYGGSTETDSELGLYVLEGGEAIESLYKTYVDGEAPVITVDTKPVSSATKVIIQATITISGVEYNAYVQFEVVPDKTVTLNYPNASGEARDVEYVYLSAEEGNSFLLNFVDKALFGDANRVVVKNKAGEDITEESIEIVLSGTSWKSYIETNSIDESGKLNSTSITLSWKTSGASVNSIVLSFIIKVDGIERETYSVRLDKNIGNLLSYEINYFGDTEVSTDSKMMEIFILSAEQQKIFSSSYQLLTFQGKSTLADNTVITAKENAKISIDNGSTFLDSITLDKTYAGQTIKLLLNFSNATNIPSERIDPYATGDNSFDKYFTITNNNQPLLFSDIATVGTSEVKTRISVYYRGDLVDYSKYASALDATNNGYSTMGETELDFSEASSGIQTITFNLSYVNDFVTYNYKAVFDFKIGNGKTVSSGFMETLEANETSLGILGVAGENNIWEITRYNGQNYTQDYFTKDTTRSISISLYLVATLDYDYTQFEDQKNGNIPFPAVGSGDNYVLRYLATVGGQYNYPPSRVAPIQQITENGGITYDFNILADGAENEGNYVVYKVTYSVQIADNDVQTTSAYIMIKILPDWQYTLTNAESATSIQNSQSTPLYLYYEDSTLVGQGDSITTLPLTIAKSGDSSRVVIKHKNGTNLTNQATNFTYTLSSNLKNYLKMASTGNNVVQFVEGSTVAHYGDIEGYIDITDVFGYTLRYYVTLKAKTSSTNIVQIIDSTGAQVQGSEIWEGSSIRLLDYDDYINTAVAERQSYLSNLDADYFVLVSYYNNLSDSGDPISTFKALNSSNEDTGALVKTEGVQNRATFNVMDSKFYDGAMSIPLTLEIMLEADKNGETEEVLISTSIYLKQRYAVSVTPATSNNVLDNQNFDVSNFISISDIKSGNSLGSSAVGNKDYSIDLSGVNLESGSLNISVEIKRQGSVSITGNTTIHNSELNGGDGQIVFLSDFKNFESVDFSLYDLQAEGTYIKITEMSITGDTSQNNTPILYTYKETVNGSTAYKIMCLNTTKEELYLQLDVNKSLVTGGTTTEEKVAFVYGKKDGENVTYTAIASSKNNYKLEFNSQNFVVLENVDVDESFDYLPEEFDINYLYKEQNGNYSVKNSVNLTNLINKDKKVMLSTIDIASLNSSLSDEEKTVTLNVKDSTQGVKQVGFILDYDGVQVKSLRNELSLNDVWGFELSDKPLSNTDMLKVKATTLYSDTISLLISADFANSTNKNIYFEVYNANNEKLTTTPYVITVKENYSHYVHVSLSTILNKTTYTQNEISGKYKIEITHYNPNSQIEYNGSFSSYDEDNKISTLTINDFQITELSADENNDIAASDKIDIKSVQQFNVNTKTTLSSIFKGYVTKFAKSDSYNASSIGYTVTPNPYGVDTNGNTGTLRYKQIDAASCEPKDEGNGIIYTIPLSLWTENYQVVGKDGNVVSLLNSYYGQGNKIFFEINTNSTIEGFGAGLATIDQNGNIITDAGFDVKTNAIVVSVRAYVDYVGKDDDKANSIEVGTVALVLTENTLTAPSVGVYTVQRRSTGLDSEGQVVEVLYESCSYEVETPNDKVIQLDGLFPDRTTGGNVEKWQYNYNLITLFKDSTSITADTQNTTNLNIDLYTITDRTILKNQEVSAIIQAVSKTSGTVIDSAEFKFKFDANGYHLTLNNLSAEGEESTPYSIDETNISNYNYKINLALKSIYGNEIITGLNYDYRLIITNYSTTASGSIVIDDMNIGSENADFNTDEIAVFKVDAYIGDDKQYSKYVGYVSDTAVEIGGLALDLENAFANEDAYESITRYETVFTGLVLNQSIFENIDFESEGYITPSIDNANTEVGKNHSWLLVAEEKNNSVNPASYINLINVQLKYKKSFVIGGIETFENSLSPIISDQSLVNIDDLINFTKNNNNSNCNYKIIPNGADADNYTYIKNVNYIYNADGSNIPTYSFYKLEYNGSNGLTKENYIVKNNGTLSSFNMEQIGNTSSQEIKLTNYLAVSTKLESISPNTNYMFVESFENSNSIKVQFINIAKEFDGSAYDNKSIYQTDSRKDFLSALNPDVTQNPIIGTSSIMKEGTTLEFEDSIGKVYSLKVKPTTSEVYYYYLYMNNTSSLPLEFFTPNGQDMGTQTQEELYSRISYFVINKIDISSMPETFSAKDYLFIANNDNEKLIEYKYLTAIQATLNDTVQDWLYFDGLNGTNFVNQLTEIKDGTTIELTGGKIYSITGVGENISSYYYLEQDTEIDVASISILSGTIRVYKEVSGLIQNNQISSVVVEDNGETIIYNFETEEVEGSGKTYYKLITDIINMPNSNLIVGFNNVNLTVGYYEITITGNNSSTKYVYIKADGDYAISDLLGGAISGGQTVRFKLVSTTDIGIASETLSANNYISYMTQDMDQVTEGEEVSIFKFVRILRVVGNILELENAILENATFITGNSTSIIVPNNGSYIITRKNADVIVDTKSIEVTSEGEQILIDLSRNGFSFYIDGEGYNYTYELKRAENSSN